MKEIGEAAWSVPLEYLDRVDKMFEGGDYVEALRAATPRTVRSAMRECCDGD